MKHRGTKAEAKRQGFACSFCCHIGLFLLFFEHANAALHRTLAQLRALMARTDALRELCEDALRKSGLTVDLDALS